MNWWVVLFWSGMWITFNAVLCAYLFPPSVRWTVWRVMTLAYVIVVLIVFLTATPEFLFGERR